MKEIRRCISEWLLFFILGVCFFSPKTMSDNSFFVKKKGYGHNNTYIFNGEYDFYPLVDDEKYVFLYPGYLLNNADNISLQSRLNMFINLSVERTPTNKIVMVIIFENKSEDDFYIPGVYLNFFRDESESEINNSSCKRDFLIISGDFRLDYLGSFCKGYDEDPDSGDWIKIESGKKFVIKMYLNASLYAFPVGIYSYEIGTLEYPFVNERWFFYQRIYKSMFDILSVKYQCGIHSSSTYALALRRNSLQWHCVCFSNDDVNEFFERINMFGNIDENKFLIRSNNVLVEIDSLHLYHQK